MQEKMVNCLVNPVAQAILTSKPKTSLHQISQVRTESKATVQTKDAILDKTAIGLNRETSFSFFQLILEELTQIFRNILYLVPLEVEKAQRWSCRANQHKNLEEQEKDRYAQLGLGVPRYVQSGFG